MTQATKLYPEKIDEQLTHLFSCIITLKAAATSILEQADLNLSLVPSLNHDQALVRSHVQSFEASQMALILNIIESIRSSANLFTSYAPKMEGFLKKSDQASFKLLLDEFSHRILGESGVISTKQLLTKTETQLNQFLNYQIADDVTSINNDLKGAKNNYDGPAGEVAHLETSLKALQETINSLNSQISLGAVTKLPEIAGTMLGLGVSFIEPKGGEALANVVIDTSVDLIGSAIGGDPDATKNLNSAIATYSRELVRLQDDLQELGILVTLGGKINLLKKRLEEVVSSTSEILTCLNSYSEELAILRGEDAKSQLEDLECSLSRWQDLGGVCTTYLNAFSNITISQDVVN
jgi:Bacillus haemolytic enterotoxin (HBL)